MTTTTTAITSPCTLYYKMITSYKIWLVVTIMISSLTTSVIMGFPLHPSSPSFLVTHHNRQHSQRPHVSSLSNKFSLQRTYITRIATSTSSDIDQTTTTTTTTPATTSSPPPPPSSSSSPSIQRRYQTYQWKNYNINYRVEEKQTSSTTTTTAATPILLIHGFGANVNHFRFQFPSLVDEGYKVYAIDLLGFGASDKPNIDYGIDLWVDLLEDFVTDMSANMTETTTTTTQKDDDKPTTTQWIVAGNSIGGLCSLRLCERLPDATKGCVLYNCAGGMTGFRYDEIPLPLRPILYFVQKVMLNPSLGGRYFFDNFKTRETVEGILTTQGVYRDTTNVDDELLEILLGPAEDEGAEGVFLNVFGGEPGPTPESVLPNVTCPILALWGDADPWTPVDKGLHPGEKFSDYNDNFTLVKLPNVGHCPHDEAPELCWKYMLPWMRMLP